MRTYWVARALLPTGAATGVVVACDGDGDGRLASVTAGVARPPAGAVTLGGPDALAIPGLVDGHSHAFHRALRGRAAGGDFWAWRAGMYRLVDRLGPESLLALATAAFGELLLAGVTTVHEFHYHHQPPGMDD
ncbi:MAG: amidohydrolase family protein, partial [Acidimicrobiales bacterium]